MSIRVLLFAGLRERAGTSECTVETLPAGGDVEALLATLAERWPFLRELPLAVARNEVVVGRDERLEDGDEVALLPPVSGGAAGGTPHADGEVDVDDAETVSRFLTRSPPSAERLARQLAGVEHGAVTTFLGTARIHSEGREVEELVYEAYPAMADKVIERILREAEERFPGCRVDARHRIGPCPLGEASVAVAAVAPHRKEAFAACRYVIDTVKAEAPIWKQEVFSSGARWVGESEAPPAPEADRGAGEDTTGNPT